MIHEFRLSPPGRGRGLSCDANGAFIGTIPLLNQSDAQGRDRWEPRDTQHLSEQLSSELGLPIDLSSKAGGLKAISKALNNGDIARAQIAIVLLAIPNPPAHSSDTPSRDEMIKFIRELHWSGMIANDVFATIVSGESKTPGREDGFLKAGFNPDEPRDERGRWTTDGSDANSSDRGIQIADAGMSDAVDDPVAEATARATPQPNARVKRPADEHEDFWETLGARVSQDARSVLTAIGDAEISESNANLATATAGANVVIGALRDYANYRAKPWIGADGAPIQMPVINFTGDPVQDQAALAAHELLTPNAPITRPATNADRIDTVVDLASLGAIIVGPAARAIGEGTAVAADASDVAADAPFIILPSELPAGLDKTLPIGRYVIPTNVTPGTTRYGDLVGDQIGKLFQNASPGVNVILRTAPGMKGVDIEIPLDYVPRIGFRFAEIKPTTNYGIASYSAQVARWKLPAPVQAISYDYEGNIYYGFPWR